jgi:ABC-type branched-subunit amino acid transport system ATPase component
VCLLETGKVVAAGPPAIIADNDAVRRAYLGA